MNIQGGAALTTGGTVRLIISRYERSPRQACPFLCLLKSRFSLSLIEPHVSWMGSLYQALPFRKTRQTIREIL